MEFTTRIRDCTRHVDRFSSTRLSSRPNTIRSARSRANALLRRRSDRTFIRTACVRKACSSDCVTRGRRPPSRFRLIYGRRTMQIVRDASSSAAKYTNEFFGPRTPPYHTRHVQHVGRRPNAYRLVRDIRNGTRLARNVS